MSTGIGISPSVMINRMAYESGKPQGAHLLEVARLRADMARAQAELKVEAQLNPGLPGPDPIAKTVANGAEVDILI